MNCATCGQRYALHRSDEAHVRDLCACESAEPCRRRGCRLGASVAVLNEDGSVDEYLCVRDGPVDLLEHAGAPLGEDDAPTDALPTDAQLRAFARASDFRVRCLECKHPHKDSERGYARTRVNVGTRCPRCGGLAWQLDETG